MYHGQGASRLACRNGEMETHSGLQHRSADILQAQADFEYCVSLGLLQEEKLRDLLDRQNHRRSLVCGALVLGSHGWRFLRTLRRTQEAKRRDFIATVQEMWERDYIANFGLNGPHQWWSTFSELVKEDDRQTLSEWSYWLTPARKADRIKNLESEIRQQEYTLDQLTCTNNNNNNNNNRWSSSGSRSTSSIQKPDYRLQVLHETLEWLTKCWT